MDGYIYKITNGNLHYIGSTVNTLEQRLYDHKHCYTNPKAKKCRSSIIFEQKLPVWIELLDKVDITHRRELYEIEKQYIIDNECVNSNGKCNSADKKAYHKQYRDKNLKKYTDYQKNYRFKNKMLKWIYC